MNIQDWFSLDWTLTMTDAIERSTPVNNFLVDTFFPNKRNVDTDIVSVEFKRGGMQIAPYLVKNANARALNMSREKSKISWYKVPTMGARRIIGLEDLQRRQFGERPDIYRAVRPEERFSKMQAQDLADLIKMHENRKAVMASEILFTGKVKMKAFADDGQIADVDEMIFDGFNEITPAVYWDNPAAKIYEDLYKISEKIQEDAGQIPTVAICGKNVEKYLLANTEIKDWLLIQNRQNLTMASFAPNFIAPNARFIGRISALNLEIYSFADTYFDDEGNKKYLVPENDILIGIPKQGFETHSPVSIFQNGQWHTINAAYVPKYSYNDESETTSLTVYSRFILTPAEMNDFYVIHTKG